MPTMMMLRMTVPSSVPIPMPQSRNAPTVIAIVPAMTNSLYLPMRETTWPVTMLPSTIINISGVRIAPLEVALLPITPCTNQGLYRIMPNIAAPPSRPRMAEVVKTSFLNSSSGRIGSLARISTKMKPARPTTASTNPPTTCHESQG